MNTTSQPYTSRPTSLLLPPAPSAPSTTSQSFYTPQFQSLLTPTATSTPLAMTPNTLKSIEQSILQTLGEDTEESYMMESQQYSGNFVPPLPSSTSTITLINTWQGGQVSSEVDPSKDTKDEPKQPDPEPEIKKKQPQKKKQTKPQQPQKKQQKEKPKKTKQPQQTEEEERRRVRRERNKQAAARCRKRRLDHTNKLVNETEGLEAKKRSLQTQITELQSQKEELEFILEAHNCTKKQKQEVQVLSDLQNLPPSTQPSKLKRPNTLNVISDRPPVSVQTPAPPIPINTPSNGIAGLGFEPLCSDWGVHTPTPIQDTVVGDDLKMNVPESRDLTSKCSSLVTPVNPYKKLHDL